MAINERVITGTQAAAADGGAASAEQNLILHLDASDVDSYDGDGDIWYDISEHDVTIPLSDNASNLKCHLNFSDSTSYGGTGTTVTDISDESNDFTFTGITASDFDKDNGGYVDLDNSGDYLERSSTTSGHFDGDYTLELWVNPHENNNFTYLYCKQSASTNGLLVGNFAGSTGQLEVYRYTTSGSANADTFTGSGITANQWNHVAIVFSGTNGFLYVNGEQKDSSTVFTGTYPSDFTNMRIGGGYNTAYDTNGELGVFRLYDKALSPSEVGQNYRHGRDYIYTDLVDDTNLGVHLDAGNTDSYDPDTDGSTWSDLTTSNADVTLTSMNANQHDKEIGGWFSFDGSSDYGTITNDAVRVTTGGALTVEMWIRPSSITVSNKYFLGQSQNTNASYSYSVNQTNQTLRLLTYSHSGGFAYAVQLTTGNVLTQANKWYHFAFTLSDTVADNVIYINGENVKQATSNGIGTERGSTNQLQIGAINGGSQWQGDIGQVRIYQETLTADEVMQNYLFTKNDYPNTNHADLTSLTHNSSGYFTYDSTSDKSVISNAKSKGLVPNSSTNITTLVWARIHSTTALSYILTGRNQSSSINNFYFRHYNNNLTLAIYDDGGVRDINQNFGSLSADTWYLLGFRTTTDGSARVNVITTGTSTFTDATNTMSSYESTDVDFNIGFYQTNFGFDGDIGAVKVYNKYLSDSEITSYFNSTKSTYGL